MGAIIKRTVKCFERTASKFGDKNHELKKGRRGSI